MENYINRFEKDDSILDKICKQLSMFDVDNKTEINVAILGSVSAGKSTLLNALFAKTFSDMDIKRTTMIPQIYKISNNQHLFDDKIRSKNRELNNKYYYKIKEFAKNNLNHLKLYNQNDKDFDIIINKDKSNYIILGAGNDRTIIDSLHKFLVDYKVFDINDNVTYNTIHRNIKQINFKNFYNISHVLNFFKPYMCPKLYNQKSEIIDNISRIENITHDVSHLYNFDNLPNGFTLKIHDLPGINNAMTKQLYMDYIKRNFPRYDIIIFVIDINSSFNTSDEMDFLNLLKNCIKNNKKLRINTKIIALVNKCDDMDNSELDGEYKELFQNICTTLSSYGLIFLVIPISCENAYIFRTIHRDRNYQFDKKYVDKLGNAMMGSIVWKSKTIEEKLEFIRNLDINDINSGIEMSGFENFKSRFINYLSGNNLLEIFLNKYVCKIIRIIELKSKYASEPEFENVCKIFKIQIDTLSKIICQLKILAKSNNIDPELVDTIMKQYIETLSTNWIVIVNEYVELLKNYEFSTIRQVVEDLDNILYHNKNFVKTLKLNNFEPINNKIYKKKIELIENVIINENLKEIIENFDCVIYLFKKIYYYDKSLLSHKIMLFDNWKYCQDIDFKQVYDYFSMNFNWNSKTKFYYVTYFLEKIYDLLNTIIIGIDDVSYIYWSFRVINKYYKCNNFVIMNENACVMENLLFRLTNMMNHHEIISDKLDEFNAIMMMELCELYNLIHV